MIDQVRAIDNKRFLKKLGVLPESLATKVKDNLVIIMDLDYPKSSKSTISSGTPIS